MNGDNNDNSNRDGSQVIVVEAEPIILGGDQPVTPQGGDAVFVMPAANDAVVSDPPQSDDTVVSMGATVEQPNTQKSEPPADDNVIIPMGAADESQDLDKQLAEMLETKQAPADEIEEIETQVNAILSNDVISPLDEQLLAVLQQRLEELLSDPARTQTQPIEAPTAAQETLAPTEEPPAPAVEQAEEIPVPQPSDAPIVTPVTVEPEPVSPRLPDETTLKTEAAAAKASLLAYLALLPPEVNNDENSRADDRQPRAIESGRDERGRQEDQSEIEALKSRLEEVESQLRRQRREDDRPRETDRRRMENEMRQRLRDERRAPSYNTGSSRGRDYDEYYDAPARDKPSSILDNMFQQWFESEVTEKFKSLFDDKKDRRDGDDAKEIRPEMVTVTDPVSLPGLIPLGKNMYFNPSDNKAYFIAPVSSLPPGMSAPNGSAAPTKRPAAKKPVRRPRPVHARPRRRRPPYAMRRRPPYGGRPLRRPPRRY